LIILNVSKARFAKIKELDLASLRDSDSFNFYASLRQERLQNYQNSSLEYRYYTNRQAEDIFEGIYKLFRSQNGRQSKKLQFQGTQILRREAYL